MNVLDLIIVGLLGLAVVHGVTQGAAMQVLSFGGFWGGLALGAVLGPPLAGLANSPFSKAFVSLLSLFGMAAVGAGLGRTLGTHAWRALQRLRLGAADAALGAGIAVVATLVAVWLFAIIVAEGPVPEVARTVQSSRVVRALVERLPPAPQVFSRIQALVSTTPFPKVFTGFEPSPEPVPLPDDPTVRAAVQAAGASTVRVFGFGCGGTQTGSGFFAGPGVVVTNAHVIAGIESIQVQDQGGRRGTGTPVLFDPNLDLAVLRVRGLSANPLPIVDSQVERGTGGAVIGYPGGGPFTAGAGAVIASFEAVGRDIYGRGITRRQVYQLQASVRPGNSGGPFVSADGRVVGVIFAASTTDQNVGYALTGPAVVDRVGQAGQQAGAVSTGPCAA